MKVTERRSKEAKDKAEKAFTQSAQREAAFVQERDRIRTVNNEKTARLRTLRLAKEAAERDAAATAAAEKAAMPRKVQPKKFSPGAFSGEVETGSPQKMRPNNNLGRVPDST